MIETELSRTGSLILKINKRYSCSRINPEREADSWISKSRSLWSTADQIVVIGIGSAIHIHSLASQFEGLVYAVDVDKDIVNYHKDLASSQNNIIWRHLDSKQDVSLFLNEIKYFDTSTFIHSFVPAIVARRDHFLALEEAFNARSFHDLQNILKDTPAYSELSKEVESRLHSVPQGPLSIKAVDHIFPEKMATGSKELAVFKLLRELVV